MHDCRASVPNNPSEPILATTQHILHFSLGKTTSKSIWPTTVNGDESAGTSLRAHGRILDFTSGRATSGRATGSGNISNCPESRSGYDRATGSGCGRATGSGDISHCHWLFYFGWVLRPNRGYITFYNILRGFYFSRAGLSKGSVEFIVRGHLRGRLFPGCLPRDKARAERGVTSVFWTPHV